MASPNISTLLHLFLGPIGYSKFLAPIALFILGFGAWTFFNQLRLARWAALAGALVVALNSAYLSTACWGVASQQIAAGFDFMALAAIVGISAASPLWIRWARVLLAGMAVGVNIMEGADIGAIYSMFVAAFVCVHAWVTGEGSAAKRLITGAGRVAVIAVFAAFISAQAVTSLIGTQIKGVAGTEQDEATKQARWDFATQWSFPKRETLGLVIPGLFGFRMDEPDGGNYWGVSGRDASWWRYLQGDKQVTPQGFIRQSGGGCYMGVTVVLIAFWALFQSLRKDSVFSPAQRKLIWFLGLSLLLSLLFAYGKYAPFFQFVYALPYASTIRNPGKFLAIFTFSMTVLAAFGLHGLCRGYLETVLTGPADWGARLKAWWAKASVFDRRWTMGCLAMIGVALLGWLIYARSQTALEQYLQTVQFDETLAPKIAEFSIRQVGWFILFLALGVGLVTLILSGAFAGRNAKTGAILLGGLIVLDLGRANLPWIRYVNYPEKYADNPVLQKLRDKPYEHRVAVLPFRAPPEYNLFDQIYRIEWAQHHFPYYDIQSLDIIQMPRMPADLAAWEAALAESSSPALYHRRRWELTNTRYLLGAAGFIEVLNQQLDPVKQRFRIATTFDIVPKPGIAMPMRYEEMTAAINPNGVGKYALFEFTGALPRAKLFSHWQVSTNDPAVLKELASEAFDPAATVLVSGNASVTANSTGTTTNGGTVEYESYAPKRIVLKTKSETPGVLLLNDKYDPNWRVSVDGKPAELLRCNYLMRGVYLPAAGSHTVEFTFQPDIRMLYVSCSAIVIGLGLLGLVLVHERSQNRAA
ncbi:MAG: hypothetical protein U1F65_00540 [Verrucomicrobiota bacterium]